MTREGVLLTAFGGPRSLEDVPRFMRELMRREPASEVVESTLARYETIGGCSPLPEVAGSIASALQDELAVRGSPLPVRLGMRYCDPRIGTAVESLEEIGADTVVHVSLSPLESRVSTGAYREAVTEAAGRVGISVTESGSYHDASGYVGLHAAGVREALEDVASAERVLLVMTAHSLPEDDLDEEGTYVGQLRRTAAAVADVLGLAPGVLDTEWLPGVELFGAPRAGEPWLVAYQSEGRRPGRWLGPNLETVMARAAETGFDAIAVAPVGFVTDHMETLYDIDVVAAEEAGRLGLAFARSVVPNAQPAMIEVLASAVEAVL